MTLAERSPRVLAANDFTAPIYKANMLPDDIDTASSTCRHAAWLQRLHGYIVTWAYLILNSLVAPQGGTIDVERRKPFGMLYRDHVRNQYIFFINGF